MFKTSKWIPDFGQKLNNNPIPTSQGQNQPLYERHMTKSGRNRVKPSITVKMFTVAQKYSVPCAIKIVIALIWTTQISILGATCFRFTIYLRPFIDSTMYRKEKRKISAQTGESRKLLCTVTDHEITQKSLFRVQHDPNFNISRKYSESKKSLFLADFRDLERRLEPTRYSNSFVAQFWCEARGSRDKSLTYCSILS